MRWILLTLIFLNLVYFMLYFKQDISAFPANGKIEPLVGAQEGEQQGASLILLSELESIGAPQSEPTTAQEFQSQPEGTINSTSQQVSSSGYCVDIGPFNNQQDVESFVKLYGSQFPMKLVETEIVQNTGYRVSLPPLASRDDAIEKLIEINERLATSSLLVESYLITRGELENGIALGLFNSNDNATNVQATLANLGYAVNIDEVVRMEIEQSLAITGLQGNQLPLAVWSGMTSDRPYLQQKEKLCETIAQGQQFP